DQFLDDDRRAGDGLHHHQLAAFNALGDGNFTFAGEQRDGAHFAEIHADRVVGFFKRTGSQVQIAAARFLGMPVVLDAGFALTVLAGKLYRQRRFGRGLVLVDFDTVAFKGGEKVVDLLRGMHFSRKRVVDLVIKQVTALFADGNERLYRFVFFFKKNLR